MTATPAVHRRMRVAAAVTSIGVLVTSTVGYAAVQRYSGQVSLVDAGTAGGALSDGQPLNMLVVASDDRAGLSRKEKNSLHLGHQDYGAHTDTMMLVHLSGDGSHITAVSLPRDTLVTIPDWTDSTSKHHAASQAKLNAAYSIGGPKLMVQTVEAALPGSTTVPVQGFGRTFEVTVGSGFTGVSPVHLAAASKAPTSSSAPAPVHTRTAADDLCG